MNAHAILIDGPMADRVVVKPACDRRALDRVHQLVHDVCVNADYIDPRPGGRFVYCPHLDAARETTVLAAECGGTIVGTFSLTLDGPAGFHLDDEYPGELATIRREGRRWAACGHCGFATAGASTNWRI